MLKKKTKAEHHHWIKKELKKARKNNKWKKWKKKEKNYHQKKDRICYHHPRMKRIIEDC